jgi:hypothetical protein
MSIWCKPRLRWFERIVWREVYLHCEHAACIWAVLWPAEHSNSDSGAATFFPAIAWLGVRHEACINSQDAHPMMVACQWKRSSGAAGPAVHELSHGSLVMITFWQRAHCTVLSACASGWQNAATMVARSACPTDIWHPCQGTDKAEASRTALCTHQHCKMSAGPSAGPSAPAHRAAGS